MTLSNAQAALLAACTQFAGADGAPDPGTVQGLAAKYKGWLDRKDKEDKEYQAQQAPAPQRPRHVNGNLSDAVTCPVCQAQPGQPCLTDQGTAKLLHGHLIPVEN